MLSPLARRLWGVSGAGASAFFVGICGGYPLGAQTVAELYLNRDISKGEAEKLLRFCNNSGPSFLIAVIGSSLFSSRSAGLLLYGIHVSAALLTAFFFRRGIPASSPPPPTKEIPLAEALVASIRQAVTGVLSVCGFIVCFCVLSGLLDTLGLLDTAAALLSRAFGAARQDMRALLIGMLELSGGIGALRGLPLTPSRFTLCAFLCGWGGLSVQFQTMAVLAETDLDGRSHLAGRVFSALLSALFAFALSFFLPVLPCAPAANVFSLEF